MGVFRDFQRPASAFWDRVDQSGGPDACWPWTGGRASHGYGGVYWEVEGRRGHFKAHQVAFFLANGWRPTRANGKVVRHRCDTGCCNPAHLVAGTPGDNSRDMAERGRSTAGRDGLKGSTNGQAVLTEAAIVEIRRLLALGDFSKAEIGREFGVDRRTIHRIAVGDSWTHVPGGSK